MRQRLTPEQMVMLDAPAVAREQWSAPAEKAVEQFPDAESDELQLPDLEKDVAAVEEMHRNRETLCQTIPMPWRPFKPRPRPKTAIIAEAARRAQMRRETRETLQRFLRAPAPPIVAATEKLGRRTMKISDATKVGLMEHQS